MNFIHAIILSVVEGITELLPVSSTAHLLVTSALMHLEETEFLKTFQIGIQLGAVIAIALLSFKRFGLVKQWFWQICIAIVPVIVVGFFAYDIVRSILLESLPTVAIALIVGGIAMIIVERRTKEGKIRSVITYRDAFIIGLAQIFALVPGVSRSATTILSGRLLRLPRELLVLFSFFLAIPVIGGATLLDLSKTYSTITFSEWGLLLIGVVVSGVVSYVVARWFLRFVATHSFEWFGWYRIVLGAGILLFF